MGKGAAWAGAAEEIRRLVDATGMPFLPSPMGKGVVPDGHPNSVASARSHALAQADLVLLLGSRLNWIMHFGLAPRFARNLKVIQIDHALEELGNNVPATVAIGADLKAATAQLVAGLEQHPWQVPGDGPWWRELSEQVAAKKEELRPALEADGAPMGYYRPLAEINRALPDDAILVTEGSNTMDISRSVIDHAHPGNRLDGGTWGTMGLGPGFAIAAALTRPGRRVVALLGDGAFGFGGMEVEVAVRYQLPITWIVFTNNGIMVGMPELPADGPPPPFAFTPGARHDKVMEAFGAKGYHCRTPQELARALKKALASDETCLINVEIFPHATRAPQQHNWLTR